MLKVVAVGVPEATGNKSLYCDQQWQDNNQEYQHSLHLNLFKKGVSVTSGLYHYANLFSSIKKKYIPVTSIKVFWEFIQNLDKNRWCIKSHKS